MNPFRWLFGGRRGADEAEVRPMEPQAIHLFPHPTGQVTVVFAGRDTFAPVLLDRRKARRLGDALVGLAVLDEMGQEPAFRREAAQ